MRKAAFHSPASSSSARPWRRRVNRRRPITPARPIAPHAAALVSNVANGVTLTNLTPVAYFRGLLGMTPAERTTRAGRQIGAGAQQVLAKVREYQALPRAVREERLRQTELHWYLLVLLRLDPAQRKEQLKEISPLFQPMILQPTGPVGPVARRHAPGSAGEGKFSAHLRAVAGPFALGASGLRGQAAGGAAGSHWDARIEPLAGIARKPAGRVVRRVPRFFCLTGERQETAQALSERNGGRWNRRCNPMRACRRSCSGQCVESFSKFPFWSGGQMNLCICSWNRTGSASAMIFSTSSWREMGNLARRHFAQGLVLLMRLQRRNPGKKHRANFRQVPVSTISLAHS
jgi:hypothetical protein